MSAARLLPVVLLALSPSIVAADSHHPGLSQYRNGPFSEFDLTAIGIALVIVMIVLGIRAMKRKRS